MEWMIKRIAGTQNNDALLAGLLEERVEAGGRVTGQTGRRLTAACPFLLLVIDTTSAFPTARSPCASDGLFTTSNAVESPRRRAITIAVDPPPSRLIASVAPNSSAMRADSRLVVPTL